MQMSLRIVVYSELPTKWFAQALERDLMCSSHTAEAALDTLLKLVETHVGADIRKGREPLSGFEATAQPGWAKFATAAQANQPVLLTRTLPSGRLQYLVATSGRQSG